MENRMGTSTVARGRTAYTATVPDIEQVTVAALDESIGGTERPSKTLYTVIVCSPPGTPSREKLPVPEQALETPRDYGLLIGHNTSYPFTTGRAFTKAWIHGLRVLMQQAQKELRIMQHPPIGLLYIDGHMRPELYPLMGETFNGKGELVKGELTGIKVVPAQKSRSHKYLPPLDPFGKGLLTLADGIAGILREEGDRLESMV